MDMLHRLRGTTIETNIPTGGVIQTEGFALIDSYKVLSEKKRVEIREDKKSGKEETVEVSRVLRFTVTISEWFYNSLLHYDVLTLDRRYFQLSKPTDRRLYEIARKHCGDQAMWKINIDSLAEKIGTDGPRFKTRDIIRDAIERDNLFEYHIALDPRASPDDVVFYTREPAKLAKELIRTGAYDWFATLEKSESRKKSA
jgi:hypothetical protein